MKPLAILCFVVLCITLTLGLWPFHAPDNDVTWLKHSNGLAFGRFGTVLSRGPLQTLSGTGSVEIRVQPNRWTGSTLLTLYRPDKRIAFAVHQSLSDLELTSEAPAGASYFYVDDAFGPSLRQGKPVLVTVTCGGQGAKVYLDGVLARVEPGFRFPEGALAGWLTVGDSVGESSSFRGEIFGLAIYDRELTGTEASSHYQSWTKNGRPDTASAPGEIALYLFNEKSGNAIHNRVGADGELYIPEKYTIVDQIFLRPLWDEFDFSKPYWMGNLKNIVGFVPTGFCFCAYFTLIWPARRALFLALAVGFLMSLTIEVLQSFLPTRDSGMTDLITNTLGTCLGVFCYRRFPPILAERLPWLTRGACLETSMFHPAKSVNKY